MSSPIEDKDNIAESLEGYLKFQYNGSQNNLIKVRVPVLNYYKTCEQEIGV